MHLCDFVLVTLRGCQWRSGRKACKREEGEEDRDLARLSYSAMRRSLCSYDHSTSTWLQVPDSDVGSPPHGLAQKLAPLIFADSSPALEAALQRLDFGASPLSDLERLVRFFNDHVLVVVGPQAKKFWRRENVEGEDEQLHTQAWCASCEVLLARKLRAHPSCFLAFRAHFDASSCVSRASSSHTALPAAASSTANFAYPASAGDCAVPRPYLFATFFRAFAGQFHPGIRPASLGTFVSQTADLGPPNFLPSRCGSHCNLPRYPCWSSLQDPERCARVAF